MGETRTAGGAVAISRLRLQCLALVDADCVRPEDGSMLLAALDGALLDLAAGDLPAARAGMARFIAAAQRLMEAGFLAPQEGRQPLAAARALLDTLREPVPRG
jgi:hypothetical protein